MNTTISALLSHGRGILAADESLPTIGKRFAQLEIDSTEENRRAYRDLLFTTPSLGKSISGAILFDETIHQRTARGVAMPAALAAQGIVPGIKVDGGTEDFPGFPGEKITRGLDGLRERLGHYYKLGARFTKWRAVIAIGRGLPTSACIATNACTLAQFAALSQESKLVPIVEPEVLMDGNHSLAKCEQVMGEVLHSVFSELVRSRVVLEEMLLKTGMVLSGEDSPKQAGRDEIATATLRCLRRFVPASVPGIVFLSGGQGDIEATARLNAICRLGHAPWKLTFSFGRALQDKAMKTWKGSADHRIAAQAALLHRARCNGLAVEGKYSNAAERERPGVKAR